MIIILCEGYTEERFIKEIIIPAFPHLYIVPKIIMTKGGKKGGSVHYDDFIKQIKQILHNTQLTLLLTMFDLAGIPPSWWDFIKSNCPILGAGINFQAKVRAANFCLKNFWQPQVATWGYSHFQAKVSRSETLA